MPYVAVDGLEYFQFESLDNRNLKHGIFTRKGGVSPQPWDSLNQGGTVGDARENVIENRRRVYQVMGQPVESIFDVWQVHSADVICADEPRPLNAQHQKADAILTDRPEITLFMRFADCVPIVLFDPVRRVVGLVHAGWMGTVKKTVFQAIRAMQERYQSNPGDIQAGIGPSIGPDHYQIGLDVVSQVRSTFGDRADELFAWHNGQVTLNLWQANQMLLEEAGVKSIEVSGICTACDLDRWYSHRAEHGKTGRFGAIISLA
jgi:YfiH family protein